MKFNKGDFILCINGSHSENYTKGSIYIVKSVGTIYGQGSNVVLSTVYDNRGSRSNGWWSENFVLIQGVNIRTLKKLIICG